MRQGTLRLIIFVLIVFAGTMPLGLQASGGNFWQNSSLSSAFSFTSLSAPKLNGVFLSRRFLSDSSAAPDLVDDFLVKSSRLYNTQTWFPNGGLLTPAGNLDHPPGAAVVFLEHVSAYEKAHKVSFVLMPYLNGYSLQNTAHPANLRLDLSDASVRKNIVAECGKYVSSETPGSYVKGAPRVFDGIVIDIEPAGDATFFASLKTLMSEIRASFDAMGLAEKKIGIAAPQYTDQKPKPNWGWNASDYHYMARYVNYILAMTYDSSLKKPTYQQWMFDQTTHILKAVSGAAWSFDADHPAPTNGVKVLIGLPAFHTRTAAHDPAIENVKAGAAGILGAWASLADPMANSNNPTAASCFQGSFLFAHDGGADGSTYARYNQDWLEWKRAFGR